MEICKLAACFTAAFLLHAPALHAEESGKLTLETGLDYNTGSYGGSQTTDIYYMPFTVKYQGAAWTLKMTVPYLQITGPASVINLINGTAVTGAPTDRATRSGWGDALVSAGHNVYYGGAEGLIVNLTGKVKFGTASADAGLGTGKDDYALQTDVYRVSGAVTTFGSLGYRVYGSPAGFVLQNAFYGTIGKSYKFTPQTSAGVVLSLGQRVIAGGANRAEMLLYANHRFNREWKAQAYVLTGFTTSVPDWGTGVSVGYLF